MQAHTAQHTLFARTVSEENRLVNDAIAISLQQDRSGPATTAAAGGGANPLLPETPSEEARMVKIAVENSEHTFAEERAAARQRNAVAQNRLRPHRIEQLVANYWTAKCKPMPAAEIKPAYEHEYDDVLPMEPGESVGALLATIPSLAVFSPPGKTHVLVQLRTMPRTPVPRQPTPFDAPFREAAASAATSATALAVDGVVATPPSPVAAADLAITAHVFVDFSNFWWSSGAQDEGKAWEQLDVTTLVGLLIGGAGASRGAPLQQLGPHSLVVGSKPARADHPVWQAFERMGFTVKLEPVAADGGGEQLVDDALHAGILTEVVRRRPEAAAAQQKLVLVTGDGKDNGGKSNFPDCCQAALDKGWAVEVWGFDHSMSGHLRRLAQNSAGRMQIKLLNPHRSALLGGASRAVPALCRNGRSPASSPTNSPPRGAAAATAAGMRGHLSSSSEGMAVCRWGPCRYGAACTRTACRYQHPPDWAASAAGAADTARSPVRSPPRRKTPTPLTDTSVTAVPPAGTALLGQPPGSASWRHCIVVSGTPVYYEGSHQVLVQFDGSPDCEPIPMARLRRHH